MMTIQITRKGEIIAELVGQKAVADYLGWSLMHVSRAIYSGKEDCGIILTRTGEYAESVRGPVLAYTAKGVETFRSMKKCADTYNMSREKLLRLIETGATADDGITTFDFPIKRREV